MRILAVILEIISLKQMDMAYSPIVSQHYSCIPYFSSNTQITTMAINHNRSRVPIFKLCMDGAIHKGRQADPRGGGSAESGRSIVILM